MLQNKRNINFLIRSGYLKNCLKGNIFFFNVFKKIDFIFLEQCHFSVIKKNKKFPLSFLSTSLKNFFFDSNFFIENLYYIFNEIRSNDEIFLFMILFKNYILNINNNNIFYFLNQVDNIFFYIYIYFYLFFFLFFCLLKNFFLIIIFYLKKCQLILKL